MNILPAKVTHLRNEISRLTGVERASKKQSWVDFATSALSTDISRGFKFVKPPIKTLDFVDCIDGTRSYCKAEVAGHHFTKLSKVWNHGASKQGVDYGDVSSIQTFAALTAEQL